MAGSHLEGKQGRSVLAWARQSNLASNAGRELCFLFGRQALPGFAGSAGRRTMVCVRISGGFSTRSSGLFSGVLLLSLACAVGKSPAQDATQQKPTQPPAQDKASAEVPHGKKLILKDGTYQVVREYQRNGDRVRYFSEERGDWEELPAAMVDWDATNKDAVANEKTANALAEKIHTQEEAKRMDNVADIDASLQVGEGAFLPSAEGLFVVEGKTVRVVQQAGSATKKDTLRTIEQVLSPVPIVPGKQKVFLAGERAPLRLHSTTPEFYLREAPPDPDRVSPIEKSSRPGETGPDVVLIRAKQVHNGRELQSISTLFGQTMSVNRDEIAIQRWEVAPNVYRFTLGEALTPGEYVVAEVLPGGLNYFVWDFGLDGSGGAAAAKKK